MSLRSGRIFAALLIFGVLAGLLVNRWVSSAPEDPVVQLAREGAAIYATLPMARIESEREVLTILREHAEVHEDAPWDEMQRDAFLNANAAFLWRYFGQGSPDTYLAWRRQHYMPRHRDEVFNAPPGEMTIEEVFDEHWSARREFANGVNRAVKHAAVSRGIVIVADKVSHGHPHLPPSTGDLGSEYWHGGISITGRSWWKPRSEISSDGFLSARLSIVLGFADGSRRPVLIQWNYDEQANQWLLHSLHTQNSVDEGILNVDY